MTGIGHFPSLLGFDVEPSLSHNRPWASVDCNHCSIAINHD